MFELFAASDYGRVVGYYDFVSAPAVRVTGLSPLEAAAHAEHEQAHFVLAHQTTHGHLVIFANRLLARGGARSDVTLLCRELVDDGRDVHERFATYMTLAPNAIYERVMARLSKQYRMYLREATHLPPEALRGTRMGKAVFYAAVLVALSPPLPPPEPDELEDDHFVRCCKLVLGVPKRWRALARWIASNPEQLCSEARHFSDECGWSSEEREASVATGEPPSSAHAERSFASRMARHLASRIPGMDVCTIEDIERQTEPFRRSLDRKWLAAGLAGIPAEELSRVIVMLNERPVPRAPAHVFRNHVVRKTGVVDETALLARLRQRGRPVLGVLHRSWPGLDAPCVQWVLHEEAGVSGEVIVNTLVFPASAARWDLMAAKPEPTILAVPAAATPAAVPRDVANVVSVARAAGVHVVAMFAWNPVLLLTDRISEGLIHFPVRCRGRKLKEPCDILVWSLEDGMEYAQLAGVSAMLGLTELVSRGVVAFDHAGNVEDAWLDDLANLMIYIVGERATEDGDRSGPDLDRAPSAAETITRR